MKVYKLFIAIVLVSFAVHGETKTKLPCNSLIECEKKADLTSIHRKKITFLSTGIEEFSKDVNLQLLIPIYLKKIRSIILEANGETGYTGEIVLKVSHKPEYKVTQLKKAEEDLLFLEKNISLCSEDQKKQIEELKTLHHNSQ
ncbi:hypothetical protein EHQ46_10745 [Leptospira yanagawae]|uniref:Uncharacterized protein n=1 Tax=Leptospira yanagawae TaxID=293069 RepID=A0ABY2M5D1_9LEPT|nr:hypothetical protein [Leptospira yanagawae]TGL20960.1 hypothetical protein EHQ46_10745 [Leptospira yanagawae]